MATYILTAPDGREFEIDSPTPPTQELADEVFSATGIGGAKPSTNAETQNSDAKNTENDSFNAEVLRKLGGAVAAIDSGARFGLGKHFGGFVNALSAAPVDAIVGGKNFLQAFKDRYNEIVQDANDMRKEFAEEHPVVDTALEFGSMFRNPLNKAAGTYILQGGKALDSGKKLAQALNYINSNKNFIPKVARAAGAGGVTSALNTAGQAESLDDFTKSLGKNVAMGAAVGGAVPTLGRALKLAATGAQKSYGLGKRTLDAMFPKLKNVLNASEGEIQQTIKKYAPNALGDFETLGAATRQQAKSGIESLNEHAAKLYGDAYKDTNMFGKAMTFNTKQAITDLGKELDKKSRKYLSDIMEEVSEDINPTQLNALKRQIGQHVKDGRLGLTPNQESRLYDAIKKDVYSSAVKNAKRFRGANVEAKLAKADAFTANMAKQGSIKKVLEGLSKDISSDSTIGKKLFNALSQNSFDRRNMMALRLGRESLAPIRQELIALVRDKNTFNKLGAKGKQAIYGENLPEFERLFNNVWAERLDDAANGILSAAAKYGDKSGYLAPYFAQLLSK